jgi:hypothetical protein
MPPTACVHAEVGRAAEACSAIWDVTAPDAVAWILVNFQSRAVRYSSDGRYPRRRREWRGAFELTSDRLKPR